MNSLHMRWAALALTFFVALGSAVGCGKHIYNRTDLDIALGKHHIDLRWGRLENAALVVKPEMRGAFLKAWAEKAGTIEMQEIEVVGITETPDGDTADVIVRLVFVERDTMQVKTAIVSEHWVRTDSGWIADVPATLDPTTASAASASAPPADAATP